ncbi:MAG: AmmeMemoRadiSam system protein B [Candidatus Magasanikbacteria bacterium]
MPIVFAAITPHPPTLIEGIGKEQKNLVDKTVKSLEKIEQDLYVSKPDIIAIISPHSNIFENVFSINLCENYISNYEKFGNFSNQDSWLGEIILPYFIKEKAYERNIAVQLLTEHKLDHGTSIPLVALTSHLQNIKILPIGIANLEAKSQLEFGQLLYDIFSDSDKRIAIISSADLSHSLNSDSPSGFHKAGQEFDEKIIALLETHNTAGIAQMDSQTIKNSNQCGYNSILILLGCLKNINYNFKNLSYETVLGIGYLTGEFIF